MKFHKTQSNMNNINDMNNMNDMNNREYFKLYISKKSYHYHFALIFFTNFIILDSFNYLDAFPFYEHDSS